MPSPELLMRSRALGLLTLLLLACGPDPLGLPAPDAGGDAEEPDSGLPEFDAAPEETCAMIGAITEVAARSTPGGRQLVVTLTDEEGRPLEANATSCLHVTDEDGLVYPTAWGILPLEPPIVMLALDWQGNTVDYATGYVEAFLDSVPTGTRVGVSAWADTLVPVVAPTINLDLVRRRVEELWPGPPAAPLSPELIAPPASEEWASAGGAPHQGPRVIVYVSPEAAGSAQTLRRWWPSLVSLWVGSADQGDARYVVSTDDAAADATLTVRYLNDAVAAQAGLLAWCDDGSSHPFLVSAGGDTSALWVDMGDAATEHKRQPCTPESALNAGPEVPGRVDLSFDDDELAAYQTHYHAPDKDVFTGGMRLSSGEGWARFEGHFRGQSSLGCERKSFSFNMDGNDVRRPVDGAATDEFFLVSMCLDDHYINQVNGDLLMEQLGIWDLALGYIELAINGQSQGVYLYIDDPGEALKQSTPGLLAVVRRRQDIDGKRANVEWAAGDPTEALLRYEAFLGALEGLTGAPLLRAVTDRMDLDQYLRWIALMSLLHNGDYVDEVYFLETASVDESHAPRGFYTIQGWDPDDLFSECHHGGRFALDDPNGLLFCTESILDHAIFTDPEIYAHYVDILEAVIEAVPDERFVALTNATAERLNAFMADPDVRGAMVELQSTAGPLTLDRALSETNEATATLQATFSARRAELLSRIATYRSAE